MTKQERNNINKLFKIKNTKLLSNTIGLRVEKWIFIKLIKKNGFFKVLKLILGNCDGRTRIYYKITTISQKY